MSETPSASPPPSSPSPAPPEPGRRLRDRLEAVARSKPVAPPARKWVWIAALGAGGVVVLLQALGVTKSPVAARLEEEARARTQPDAPKEPRRPEEPVPDALPAELATALRADLRALAAGGDARLAAIATLPARVAAAPDAARAATAALVLTRLTPLARLSGAATAPGLRAAAEVLHAAPDAPADVVTTFVVHAAGPVLASRDAGEDEWDAAVEALRAVPTGPARAGAAAALRTAAHSLVRRSAHRVNAIGALHPDEVRPWLTALHDASDTPAAVRDAIDAAGRR